MRKRRIVYSSLMCLLVVMASGAEKKSGFDIDAADVVSHQVEADETRSVRVDGATVYEVAHPDHPLKAIQLKRGRTPPIDPPKPMLEFAKHDSSVSIPARTDRITNREQYRAGIAKLLEEHQIFLRDFTPKKPDSRVRVDLKQFDFRFETPDDKRDISIPLSGIGPWEQVEIPHYTGPTGKWTAYYRTVVNFPDEFFAKPRQMLHFDGVDYTCEVYLNGRCLGTHTGYFAPFDFDVTDYVKEGEPNVLMVVVRNDQRMRVYGGEKIIASAPLGFDDPHAGGWGHTGWGAGLWQNCYFEAVPDVYVKDIYCIPDLETGLVDTRVVVNNVADSYRKNIDLSVSIYPKNFEGRAVENIPFIAEPVGSGEAEYRALIKLDDFRVWNTDHPWLYTIRARVAPASDEKKETVQTDYFENHFGMRSFKMDLDSTPKGRLYLNEEPIILRGSQPVANFLRNVYTGDTEQLIEDIMIYKLAGLNFIRLCQTPHQKQAYEMFDRLGIMVQTDLPIFGEIRRPQVAEVIKQAGEMEQLIRSHPSNIMVSFINEPGAPLLRKMGHRHLFRPDMHRVFKAAENIVHIYNPSRVVKPIDGDYDPPSPGFPDDHIYGMWYLDHGVPIGMLNRGYWINNKKGWYSGCGEWGLSSMEDADTMFEYFPEDWLPKEKDVNAPWDSKQMGNASQFISRGLNWYDRQETLAEHIRVSQAHQERGIDWTQRAFRRMSDRLISTAQFLLIDGWPRNCWGFSLVDVARRPKPSYYAMREACKPLMVDIRTDRLKYFGGENLDIEFWVCNDRAAPFGKGTLAWQVEMDGKTVFAQSTNVEIPSYGPLLVGGFPWKTPDVEQRTQITVRAALLDPEGKNISDYHFDQEIFPAPKANPDANIAVLGETGRAALLIARLGAKTAAEMADADLVIIDQLAAYNDNKAAVAEYVKNGGTVLFLEQPPETSIEFDGKTVSVIPMAGKHFISRKTGHPVVAGFRPDDFSYWFNPQTDYMDHVARSYVQGEGLVPIFLTIDLNFRTNALKEDIMVDAELKIGRGSIIFSQLSGLNRLDVEPIAVDYYQAILDHAEKL